MITYAIVKNDWNEPTSMETMFIGLDAFKNYFADNGESDCVFTCNTRVGLTSSVEANINNILKSEEYEDDGEVARFSIFTADIEEKSVKITYEGDIEVKIHVTKSVRGTIRYV